VAKGIFEKIQFQHSFARSDKGVSN